MLLTALREAVTSVVGEYTLVLTLAGVAFLAAASLPRRSIAARCHCRSCCSWWRRAVLVPGLDAPDPQVRVQLTERLTELGLIVALLGAGLKLDRPVGWRRWATTWRLLGIAMPLTIAAVAFLGWGLVGLAPASAVLLAAAVAPTDPVLAADVQVGEPTVDQGRVKRKNSAVAPTRRTRCGSPSPARPASTTAWPSRSSTQRSPWPRSAPPPAAGWGPGCSSTSGGGSASGWPSAPRRELLGVVTFQPPGASRALAENREGFVALAATFLAYGIAEWPTATGSWPCSSPP